MQEDTSETSQDKIISVIGDFKTEMQRITWTEKNDLYTYTKVVIGSTFVFGLGIYVVDLVINTCLHGLSTFVKMIAG